MILVHERRSGVLGIARYANGPAPRAIIGHKLKMLEASRAAEDRRAGRAGSSGTVGEARQQRAKYLFYSHRFKTFFPVRCHAKQVFETVRKIRGEGIRQQDQLGGKNKPQPLEQIPDSLRALNFV
jgi:hypothetical protein